MELGLASLKKANALEDILVSFEQLADAVFFCWCDGVFFGCVDV